MAIRQAGIGNMCYATCVINVHKCIFSCDIGKQAHMLMLEWGRKGSCSLPSLNTEWSAVTELIPVQVYKDESKHSNPLVSRPQLAHRRSGHKPDLLNY